MAPIIMLTFKVCVDVGEFESSVLVALFVWFFSLCFSFLCSSLDYKFFLEFWLSQLALTSACSEDKSHKNKQLNPCLFYFFQVLTLLQVCVFLFAFHWLWSL